MTAPKPTIWQEIDEVKAAVSQVLAHAKALGASSAEASMNRTAVSVWKPATAKLRLLSLIRMVVWGSVFMSASVKALLRRRI